MFRKPRHLGSAAAVGLATVAVAGTALAARPLTNSFYADSKSQLTLETDAKKNISQSQLYCPAGHKPRYIVHPGLASTGRPIAVNKQGTFHFDQRVAVNTPDGGTLLQKSRVVFSGRFVSPKEVKGTYHLYKGACKTYAFDAKRTGHS